MRVYSDRNGEMAGKASSLLQEANYAAEDLDKFLMACKEICEAYNVDYDRIEECLKGEYYDLNRYNQERVDTLPSMKTREGQFVVIDGEVYHISRERPNTSGWNKGHGGREFRIKFNDGRIIVTHNLWYNGVVPKRFKRLLKNTAEFVR